MLKISFDKVVGHLFIDSMSLLTHTAPSWENVQIDLLTLLKITISDSFKDFFK